MKFNLLKPIVKGLRSIINNPDYQPIILMNFKKQNYQHQNSNNNREYGHKSSANNSSSNHLYDNRDVQKIIDYIYSVTEISRFKYKILEYENDLNLLTTQKYYVSANFSGTSSLLVFVKIMDRFYSCLIDRKTLSYNRQQVRIESVKIIPVNIRFDNSIYNGTIMDGIHVYNKRTNSNIFIMTDVYQFRGNDMTNDSIQHKIMNVTTYINSTLRQDKKVNSLNIVVNKLYEITEIDDLISTMDKVGGYDMKGIVFFPDISGTKLLMLDTKPNIKVSTEKTKDTENITLQEKQNANKTDANIKATDIVAPPELKEVSAKKKTRYRYVCKSEEPVMACLEVRKTDLPDVYYVSCAQKEVVNKKSVIKIIRLGIALIPTAEISATCKSVTGSKISGKALMTCKFDQNKNKWIPVSEDKSRKFPSFWNDIESNMEILVESDTESDD